MAVCLHPLASEHISIGVVELSLPVLLGCKPIAHIPTASQREFRLSGVTGGEGEMRVGVRKDVLVGRRQREERGGEMWGVERSEWGDGVMKEVRMG